MVLDWRRAFRREHIDILGLDIGSSEVKLVQLRKAGDGYAVVAAGVASIAPSTSDDSNKEVNTAAAIRKCFESTGARTRMVVCGVSGPEVAVRYFKFPALPLEEIEGAVRLEAAQVCPFNIDDGVVDYQLMPNGNDSVCGVLVASTNRLIKAKTQQAQDAALKCVLLDVDGLALLNCHDALGSGKYEEGRAGQTTAILNVGDSCTTLAIHGNDTLPFVRDITYAGNDIIEQFANETDVSPEEARTILSGASATGENSKGTDSLARVCQKLIVDVTETLRYYNAQDKATYVDRVFVCGGFSLVEGFVELLDANLPARVVLWNPFDSARCDVRQPYKEIFEKRGPAMAVAAGLATRSI